jgi:hypothetical protein
MLAKNDLAGRDFPENRDELRLPTATNCEELRTIPVRRAPASDALPRWPNPPGADRHATPHLADITGRIYANR